jgi:hypothetical protein
MYARVTTFEGGSAEALRKASEEVNSSSGPPPGVPAKGFTMLIDPDGGRSIGIALFETEEDYAAGDEALSAMTPSEDGGRRVSVEKYEVGADIRL